MANFSNDILPIIPALESASLLADNYRFYKKKKKRTADYVGQSFKNLTGAALIRATADLF